MTISQQPTRIAIHKTSGIIFTNGIIELVADEMPEGGLKLLSWKESEARVQPSIILEQRRDSGSESEDQTLAFEPVSLDASVRQAMRFPSHADSFGSSRQLLDEICEVIKQYTNLPDDSVLLAAHAVRASWFPEAPNSPIGLAICGPPSPQGQQLFRLLSCMYRRALLLGEISLAALCSLPMELSPSLFIERYDHSPRLQKLIRATFSRGYIPSKSKLVRTSCMTVICTDEPLIGAIPAWNMIEIPVAYTRAPLPVLNHDAQQDIVERFQPKLLMYRLMNCSQVMNSTFDGAPLKSPVNQLVRCLGASVVDDPDRQMQLISLLKDRDEQAEQELSWDPRVAVLEALLSLCHKDKKESVHVGDVTAEANSIMERRGELLEMTFRTVGNKLRVLGFTTGRLDSAGRGFQLKNEIRRRIHRLAWDNRVQFPRVSEEQCDYCREILA